MVKMNECLKILLDNATSFKERNQIITLLESESDKVSNNLIGKMYKSVIEKGYIDFDDIPQSKGDITKYSGFKSMMECLDVLDKLASQSTTLIPDAEIVRKAISNIVAYRLQFEQGFKLNKEFIILQYNTLVAACVEATTTLITSYVDFIKRVDNSMSFTLINTKTSIGGLCINNLKSFNKSVANGDFGKMLNAIIKNDGNSFTMMTALATTGAIIAIIAASVVIIRELIFYFYNMRMNISDKLKIQAYFLEMNKNNLMANASLPVSKRNEVIKKQAELSKKLRKLADKLAVEQTMAATKTKKEISNNNSSWKLQNIESDSASTDNNGFELL